MVRFVATAHGTRCRAGVEPRSGPTNDIASAHNYSAHNYSAHNYSAHNYSAHNGEDGS